MTTGQQIVMEVAGWFASRPMHDIDAREEFYARLAARFDAVLGECLLREYATRATMAEALHFYADAGNWRIPKIVGGRKNGTTALGTPALHDHGGRARAALVAGPCRPRGQSTLPALLAGLALAVGAMVAISYAGDHAAQCWRLLAAITRATTIVLEGG